MTRAPEYFILNINSYLPMYALKCLSKLEIHLVQNTKYQSTSEARTDSSGLTIFDKFLILSPDTSGRIMGLITYFTKLPMDFNESKYINCQSAHSHLKKTLKLFCGIAMAMDLNPSMMSSLTGIVSQSWQTAGTRFQTQT